LRQNTSPDILPATNYKRVTPPPITASIAETIHESEVVVIDVDDISSPPVLSQLQHLATPPPPPPPPLNLSGTNDVGMINIAIDENSGEKSSEIPPTTSSPQTHRRGRGSVSDNLGMTFKRVTERMRSTSRSRAKSPPMLRAADISPYESVPEFSFPRGANQQSPPISGGNGGNGDNYFSNMMPPPPPPPQPMEQVVSPIEGQPFYKHPKEVRANMPPATLQPGVYQPDNTPMI
jgi:hypothetical protein